MGYRCPVCETPQANGEHLANHLAFTAMTHGGEHAEWLDEYAPGWDDDTPEALADRIIDQAEETDHEPIDEARTSPESPAGPRSTPGTGTQFDGVVDAAVEEVLDEAQELTEEMFASDDDEPSSRAGEDESSESQDE